MGKYQKDFDTLLNDILTDYTNQFPGVDISKGSLVFIKSACLTAALWGMYKHQDYIASQIFPDTADTAGLEHHAWARSKMIRKTGETDAELLARLMLDTQTPIGGGNQYDYVRWALEVDGVKAAKCIGQGQGLGTVDVVILASGASETPDQALIDAVTAYIEDIMPVDVKALRVLAPDIITQDVTATVTGDNVDAAAVAADTTSYMSGLSFGESLYLSHLFAISISGGADDAAITTPAATVTATDYQIIRPGTINVTKP